MIEEEIQLIEIAQILVVNPRPRNPVKFQAVVASIEAVGLKKPITVCRRVPAGGEIQYELICGQGRLEACLALGKTEIPAIIKDVTREQQYLMSLVENVARRPPSYRALLIEVGHLVEKGYKGDQIAQKLGLNRTYVYGIVQLLQHGEDILIQAVDAGRIPMRTAIIISTGTDEEVQAALMDAYEKGDLRGAKLETARRIIATRLTKERRIGQKPARKQKLTAEMLVGEYERHVQHQRATISRLNVVSHRLLILSTAMKRLLADKDYVALSLAESIQTMPKHLAERIG